MNVRFIDTLARCLGSGTPRRRFLGGIAAGLPVALVGAHRHATAACREVGEPCDENSDCCAGARCKNGQCKCKQGRDVCDGRCYRLDRDEDHCGACDIVCAAGQTCCDGDCTDLQRDFDNCGACGVDCASGETCCDGECADRQSDRRHCGACNHSCPLGESCCDGECVNQNRDRANCGGCGIACATDEVCCAGTCVPTPGPGECGPCFLCPPGKRCCGGRCVDVRHDDANCGACGNRCHNDEWCDDGQCRELL
jgi:hypothetical protein